MFGVVTSKIMKDYRYEEFVESLGFFDDFDNLGIAIILLATRLELQVTSVACCTSELSCWYDCDVSFYDSEAWKVSLQNSQISALSNLS